MAASLVPLRYGLRALEEMAREQASVPTPTPRPADAFAPHPTLRPARDGSLFTLRLFTEAEDDATALVVGDARARRFAPIPPRAASLFEAYAATLAADDDVEVTIGFPLVTFVQQGSARAAPLFSRGGARARWLVGEAAWQLPPGARDGAKLPVPDGLVLEVADGEPPALHSGVWYFLFGLDGSALGAIAAAGRAGVGALVRAATRTLLSGGEGDDAEEVSNDPLTREDLAMLAEAALRRASPSRALKCHPHGLAMLPPRGDPTSSLRADLGAMLDVPLPPRGPLAVYLGARAAPPRTKTIVTHGKLPPTPSQIEAARAFEGTEDIVAVRGPPGCGKTALLHHVAAETVVACALGKTWTSAPSRNATWPLVVTSTNNTAVDQALSPFVSPAGQHGLPVGIRLGNRRTLAETTAGALTAAIDALDEPGELSLDEARRAFELRAAPVREFVRKHGDTSSKKDERARSIEQRMTTLRRELADVGDSAPAVSIAPSDLQATEQALREHVEAAERLPALHLAGPKASVARACEKWARANELRTPRVAPTLAALGLDLPFRDLDPSAPGDDIGRQRAAMETVLAALATHRAALGAPAAREELRVLAEQLARLGSETIELPLDPELYPAALAVRDAWARAHRSVLLPRLAAARDAARGSAGRGKPLTLALRELAPLFPVAGCTLLSMRASFPLERDVIERLVIDEAAQCAPIYAVPALARAQRAMVTGDTAQLPPVYTLDPRVDDRLAKGMAEDVVAPFRMNTESTSSAQAVAEPRVRTQLSLKEHFRSQPAIVDLASRFSGYTLDVRTPQRSLADVSARLDSAVVAQAVRGVGGRASEGVVNESEAACALDLVTHLVEVGIPPSDIAVLSPFVGQSLRLERELEARGLAGSGGVLVSTVHRLQGGERRVVVFSLTATERRHLRWIGERPHLLHVATSRARDHLVVLFDPDAAAREPALAPLLELLPPGCG